MPTRRGFLKMLGLGAGAAVVAPSLLEQTDAAEECPLGPPPPCPPVESTEIYGVYRCRVTDEFLAGDLEIRKVVKPEDWAPNSAFCAPMTPIYNLHVYNLDASGRPVVDALPILTVPRGHVSVAPAPSVGQRHG